MKKIFSFAIMLAAVCGLCACSADTPSDVVEESFNCVKKGDIKGYFANIYHGGKDAADEQEKSDKYWEDFSRMMGDRLDEQIDEMKDNEELQSTEVKILSEEINEEGDRAKVKVNVKIGDNEKERTIKLRKVEGGKWKLTRGLDGM